MPEAGGIRHLRVGLDLRGNNSVSHFVESYRCVMRSKVVGEGGTGRRISAAVYRLRNFGGRTSGGAGTIERTDRVF